MNFPVNPSSLVSEERHFFLCQDNDIKSKILPLFSFNPTKPNERPVGHGTAFRFDPWSRCLTAYHNLDGIFNYTGHGLPVRVSPNKRLVSLEGMSPGISYGTLPGIWLPITEGSIEFIENDPLINPNVMQNLSELAVIRIKPSQLTSSGTTYWPLNLTKWWPKIGETVLAFGYANLDVIRKGENEDRAINQNLYGSFGEIIDIENPDPTKNRGWPIIRINANWPGGMSGGPVFNTDGHVIGVVSTSVAGVSSAACFFGWKIPQRILGSIDPENPGFFRNYAVFNSTGELVHCGQDKDRVQQNGIDNKHTDFGIVSINPISGIYVRL